MHGVLECENSCHLESHFGRVDVMERSINESNLEINYGISRNNSTKGSFLYPIEGRLDEFLGNCTPNDFVFDFYAFSFFLRLELDDGMTILAATAVAANMVMPSSNSSLKKKEKA